MTMEEMRQILYREPFQPFRVRLTDGRTFDLVHPNLGMAAESIFIIGIPAPDDPNPVYYDTQEWVRWNTVAGVELLPAPAAPTPL